MSPEDLAQARLDDLALALFRIAAGRLARSSFPIRILDAPDVMRAVLMAPEAFPKNYAFLEAFAHGRFSAADETWRARAAITQPHYARNPFLRDPERVEPIYRRRFAGLGAIGAEAVYDHLVAAALEVASLALGLNQALPWREDWLSRARALLARRQWIGFGGAAAQEVAAVDQALRALRAEMVEPGRKILSRRPF